MKSVVKTAGWAPGFGVQDSTLGPARSTTASTSRFCLRSYTWARAFLDEVPARTDRSVGSFRLTYGKKAPRGNWPYDSITWNVSSISATVNGSSGPGATGAASRPLSGAGPAANRLPRRPTSSGRDGEHEDGRSPCPDHRHTEPGHRRPSLGACALARGLVRASASRWRRRWIRRSRVAGVCALALDISRRRRRSVATEVLLQPRPWRARCAASRSCASAMSGMTTSRHVVDEGFRIETQSWAAYVGWGRSVSSAA